MYSSYTVWMIFERSLNNLCEVEKKHLLLAYIMGMRMCHPSTQYEQVGNQ